MIKKHIVFDIDGTLIDTETAVLKSLQETMLKVTDKRIEIADLKFALGIPGKVTLKHLGIQEVTEAAEVWNSYFRQYAHTITVFNGVESLLQELQKQEYKLGIITSKNRAEYATDFLPFQLSEYFDTIICVEDAALPKPSPEPMIEYLKRTGANTCNVLYVGDSIYDFQCASNSGVEFGLALWGCKSIKHIYADYFFKTPRDILYMLNSNQHPFSEMPWLKWAMELQFISQTGITYSEDQFDKERFERLREISAEIMSFKGSVPTEYVKSVFCNEEGFQTPKLDTRAAIFEGDKILLVKENNGTWSMPGGWVDVLESIKSNTVKEVKEEAGLDVIPTKLIALQDRNRHNLPIYAYGICKAFVLCEIIGGEFELNTETSESAFWGMNELPELATEKNNEHQIKMCFDAYNSKNWEVIFD
jgi:HAD superfamily hydrolase (TIGR01549 family)